LRIQFGIAAKMKPATEHTVVEAFIT